MNKLFLKKILFVIFFLCMASFAFAHGMSEAEKQTILDGGNVQYL